MPNPKILLDKLGDKLSNKSLEEYRKNVDSILETAGIKVVVFIDDIDRLNNEEIHAIFRLVKLTADFKNTVYVLAFDDELVAESLRKQYSRGGHDFLEKIIQVPLRLPTAQKSALKKFTLKHLNTIFQNYEIEISQEEIGRLVKFLDYHITPSMNNPRAALRFSNSINFSMPLLIGEVNTVELILIEAIKVIYPRLYNFIRENGSLFTSSYKDSHDSHGNVKANIKRSKGRIDVFMDSNPELSKDIVIALIQELFPQTTGLFDNFNQGDDSKDWYLSKRICSGRYFERYFSYEVIEGEISDVFFGNLLKRMTTEDFFSNGKELQAIFDSTNCEELALKFQFLEGNITQEESVLLSQNIALLGNSFPNPKGMFSSHGTFWQMAIFISVMVEKTPIEKRLDLAKLIIGKAQPLNFACEIWGAMYPKDSDKYQDGMFGKDQFLLFSDFLVNRAKKEVDFKELVETIEDKNLMYLMNEWGRMDSDGIKLLNQEFLINDESNFNKFFYDNLIKVIDIEFMYEKLLEIFGMQEAPIDHRDTDKVSDEQLVGLFQQIHSQSII